MKLKIKIDRDTSKHQQQIKMNFRVEVTWKVSYIPRFNRLIQKKSNKGSCCLNDDLLKKKLNLKFHLFISLGHLVGKMRTTKHFTEESKLSINYQLIFVLLIITCIKLMKKYSLCSTHLKVQILCLYGSICNLYNLCCTSKYKMNNY